MSPTLQAAYVYAGSLPHPKPAVTIPIIIIFAVVLFVAISRKLMGLAVIAAIIAVLFLAYQAGAFNHWVKEGKTAIHGK